MYKGNLGVNAVGDQIDILKDHFNQNRPDDARFYKKITFSRAVKMIEEAKAKTVQQEESVEETETVQQVSENKPKKRGRPKKEA